MILATRCERVWVALETNGSNTKSTQVVLKTMFLHTCGSGGVLQKDPCHSAAGSEQEGEVEWRERVS